MPKCTINGKEIEVKEGTSIIDAIYKVGANIAHYCYHPGLSVAGVCRLCMVEIEGNPRLQIACNTTVAEGMKVLTDSPKVKDAVKWGLDFHLINHPLDCPICDQAGECGLQEQYMAYGQYDPEMAEKKVKKHKVVDLGPTVVLDSERCILCSRCVRFTKEVSKTEELGIFNRGDHSEIGTFDGKKLDNKYSLNTVDICPVGALTSKDFRFRQRVWYLKDGETVCNGCSTGCNVKVYFNKEGVFRVKPVHNEKVNGYWMCDEGRNTYKFVNKEARWVKGQKIVSGKSEEMHPGAVAKDAATHIKEVIEKHGPQSVALVVTGQYSVEEYESMLATFVNDFKSKNVYHWVNNAESFESFDGLLIRGDKNPNTKGLLRSFDKFNLVAPWSELERNLDAGKVKLVIVAGPENPFVFNDIKAKVSLFKKADSLIWMGSPKIEDVHVTQAPTWLIPLKTFVEKEGTFINHQGIEQKFRKVTNVISEALTLSEASQLLSGKTLMIKQDSQPLVEANKVYDRVTVQNRKKNEFTFKRGSL
jgi:NADH-quinone oxidoreductase subunit G